MSPNTTFFNSECLENFFFYVILNVFLYEKVAQSYLGSEEGVFSKNATTPKLS